MVPYPEIVTVTEIEKTNMKEGGGPDEEHCVGPWLPQELAGRGELEGADEDDQPGRRLSRPWSGDQDNTDKEDED